METNFLAITGRVIEIGRCRTSPAGITQQRFRIEHRSRQVEAGFAREARCRVDVKVAGEELARMVAGLEVGQQVGIEGFLAQSGHRNSEAGIVLHATRIKVPDDATPSEHH